MQPVIHETTQKQLKSFLSSPSHAVLIVGPGGSGKGTIASYISSELLGIPAGKLTSHPYYLATNVEGPSISIDTIRSLQDFIRLKTPGANGIRRIIVVENAARMTIEAQNAFLKLLEEPPADTVVILTAESTRGLLPTVVSRAQTVALQPPTREQLYELFENQGHKTDEIRKIEYISGAQVGLMHALLNSNEEHPLISGIAQAKQLLQYSPFERLIQIDKIAKQKDQLNSVVEGLQRICTAGLKQSIDTDNLKNAKRWQNNLKRVLSAQEALQQNGQPKLVLTELLLNI